ncbi:MAG: 23S rRNA (pseudouridine(1915)-N(3))-methyltransferase RlmH [Oligoflexia bacterium]|nr:23S rRNA (pseudouridine(1915)-N(3))-methyltransferase RlmH [Oligoflexia bacterium]
MKFFLVYFGKSKFSFVDQGIEHYQKSVNTLSEVQLVELKENSKFPEKESEEFEKWLKKQTWFQSGKNQVYLLDDKGSAYGSEEFAQELKKQEEQSVRNTIFVIGGAYGHSEGLRKKYKLLSLSLMTFPHDLVRVILLEQLYRALQIQVGGKYHHS